MNEAHAPRFPKLDRGGGYESYYARAVDPESGRAVWLRHTVHAAGGGEPPVGSIWLTLFGAGDGVRATKESTPDIAPSPAGDWIRIGGSSFGPNGVEGEIDGARWSLRWESGERELHHLPSPILYRTPLPKTKPVSPLPAARIGGEVEIGDTRFELHSWPGMVGHNWGRQHAERWIWLHGVAFEEHQGAWLDLVLGRVLVGTRVLPWIASGVLSLGEHRYRIGGLARRPQVDASPAALSLVCGGSGSTSLALRAESPIQQTVVWRYADPDGSEHHVANCSAAALEVQFRGRHGDEVMLTTRFGGAYELGMRETSHGLAVQPFSDP